jgi:hypothetical protein
MPTLRVHAALLAAATAALAGGAVLGLSIGVAGARQAHAAPPPAKAAGGGASTSGAAVAAAPPGPCTVIGGLGYGTRWISGVGTEAVAKAPRAREAEAEALIRANDNARADLRARVCVGLTDYDCASVMSGAHPGMHGPVLNADRTLACAIWGILEPFERAPSQRAAEAQVSALATTLGGALAGGADSPVLLESVTTNDGCAVPELAALGFRIRNALPGVSFVDASVPRADARRVRLEVSESGADLQVNASVVAPDGTARAAGQAVFPREAYGLDALPRGTCIADRVLGLSGGRRAGAGGLQVALSIRAGDDQTPDSLCAGQSFSLEMNASAPARIHVYSVTPDGSAVHVWPEPAGSGRLTGTQSLGTFAAAPSPGGDERIVAVAVPEGAPKGPLDAHRGFCRVNGFSAATIPADAAVASVTWRIDARADACAGQTTWDERALAKALANLAACQR